MLSEHGRQQIADLRGRYPERRSALLPALYVAQAEAGHLPDDALVEVAELLDLPPVEVLSTASYYTMFFREKVGKHIIRICTNLSCHLVGADPLADYLQKALGIRPNQTTMDGLFTLEMVECLGACAEAPAMLVDEELYGHMTAEKVDRVLQELRA